MMRRSRVALLAFAGLALVAPTAALAQECINTVRFTYVPSASKVCTNSGNVQEEDRILEMTAIKAGQMQLGVMQKLLESLQQLTLENRQLRETLERVIVQEQIAMRNDVVAQLAAIPGQVAGNQAVVDSLAAAVASRLAADERFTTDVATRIDDREDPPAR